MENRGNYFIRSYIIHDSVSPGLVRDFLSCYIRTSLGQTGLCGSFHKMSLGNVAAEHGRLPDQGSIELAGSLSSRESRVENWGLGP